MLRIIIFKGLLTGILRSIGVFDRERPLLKSVRAIYCSVDGGTKECIELNE